MLDDANKKFKLVTLIGTRPEIIKLSRVIAKCDEHLQQILVHSGQNFDYELNEIFFADLELRKPDAFLAAAGETGIKTIANTLVAFDAILEQHQPDAVLLLGDTNSCLGVIAAKRRKIPIFHMEAGNRCFDQNVPEEINRKMIDHISDINLTYTSLAKEYLLREGLPAAQVIKTGSPMAEVLAYYMPKIMESTAVTDLGLQKHQYFLLSAHREENVDVPERLEKLIEIISTLATRYACPIVFSAHPRTRKMIEKLNLKLPDAVKFMKPFAFTDYVNLQLNAKVVLSDSGTITEESSILNFPALNLRETHERPEGMEEGSVMLVNLSLARICQAIDVLAQQPRGEYRALHIPHDYQTTNVSEKVVRLILSYTDYVHKYIWHK